MMCVGPIYNIKTNVCVCRARRKRIKRRGGIWIIDHIDKERKTEREEREIKTKRRKPKKGNDKTARKRKETDTLFPNVLAQPSFPTPSQLHHSHNLVTPSSIHSMQAGSTCTKGATAGGGILAPPQPSSALGSPDACMLTRDLFRATIPRAKACSVRRHSMGKMGWRRGIQGCQNVKFKNA